MATLERYGKRKQAGAVVYQRIVTQQEIRIKSITHHRWNQQRQEQTGLSIHEKGANYAIRPGQKICENCAPLCDAVRYYAKIMSYFLPANSGLGNFPCATTKVTWGLKSP